MLRLPTGGLSALLLAGSVLAAQPGRASDPVLFPADGSSNANPDTHLTLRFSLPPRVGGSGQIRVYDATTRAIVDTLDLAVPAGPGVDEAQGPGAAPVIPRAEPLPQYQRTVIGGFSEGFHFHPVIVRDNTATVYLHNNALAYGRLYEVRLDRGVIVADGFDGAGITWTFRTRARPPAVDGDRVVVAADGSGDFNTVQGAVDAIQANHPRRITVFIKSGRYEEIVYFRQKRDVTFLGEDRERVLIGYANNERFNGPPTGMPTNERPDTFPYRRAVFMADRSTGIQIVNLTIENFTPRGGGQAEALLLSGGRNLVSRATLRSHQDTVQFNDSVYVENSVIEGDTDFLWGRGPAFFRNSVLRELSTGPFMWVRSTAASHGFVFDRCRFETTPGVPPPLLARNTANYPDSEIVLLDSTLGEINPLAWQLPPGSGASRYGEFNSRRIDNGAPADVSQRHPASRQLSAERDADAIARYKDPAYVLGGWAPEVEGK